MGNSLFNPYPIYPDPVFYVVVPARLNPSDKIRSGRYSLNMCRDFMVLEQNSRVRKVAYEDILSWTRTLEHEKVTTKEGTIVFSRPPGLSKIRAGIQKEYGFASE